VRGVLLEYRRVVGPVQLTVLILALASLAVSVGLVLPRRNDALRRPALVAAVVGLGTIALFVVLLPAGFGEDAALDAARRLGDVLEEPFHLDGLRTNAGMETPPLHPRSGGRLRRREVATGVGRRP
jgi:hypothetical protein